jgi:hypothetical protein
MIVALLFINILNFLLFLIVIRALMVFNDKMDIIRKSQVDFHSKNADLWKENAELLRNSLS